MIPVVALIASAVAAIEVLVVVVVAVSVVAKTGAWPDIEASRPGSEQASKQAASQSSKRAGGRRRRQTIGHREGKRHTQIHGFSLAYDSPKSARRLLISPRASTAESASTGDDDDDSNDDDPKRTTSNQSELPALSVETNGLRLWLVRSAPLKRAQKREIIISSVEAFPGESSAERTDR